MVAFQQVGKFPLEASPLDAGVPRTVLTHIVDLSHAKAGSSIEPVIVPEFIDFDSLLIVSWRVHQCHRNSRHTSALPLEPEEFFQLKLMREGTKRITRLDSPRSSVLDYRIRHATATRGGSELGLAQ